MRAVTFQSIVRTSSPGWYWRTSMNSMPRPLNTEWYSPAKLSLTSFRVVISIRRILAISSFVSMSLGYVAVSSCSRCAEFLDSCPVSRYGVTFLRRNDGVGAEGQVSNLPLPHAPPFSATGFHGLTGLRDCRGCAGRFRRT